MDIASLDITIRTENARREAAQLTAQMNALARSTEDAEGRLKAFNSAASSTRAAPGAARPATRGAGTTTTSGAATTPTAAPKAAAIAASEFAAIEGQLLAITGALAQATGALGAALEQLAPRLSAVASAGRASSKTNDQWAVSAERAERQAKESAAAFTALTQAQRRAATAAPSGAAAAAAALSPSVSSGAGAAAANLQSQAVAGASAQATQHAAALQKVAASSKDVAAGLERYRRAADAAANRRDAEVFDRLEKEQKELSAALEKTNRERERASRISEAARLKEAAAATARLEKEAKEAAAAVARLTQAQRAQATALATAQRAAVTAATPAIAAGAAGAAAGISGAASLAQAGRSSGLAASAAALQAKDLESAVKKAGETGARSLSRLSSGSKAFERRLFSLNTALGTTTQLLFGLSAILIFRNAIESMRNFESELARVRAVTQASSEEMERLNRLARETAVQTGFNPEETAQGLKLFGQAGFSAEESISSLASSLDLATIGQIELAQAVGITTSTIRAFGLEASQAREVADVLAKSSVLANITIDDLGQSLKFAAPAASALGVDFRDLASSIVVLGDAGQRGSIAGTGLRRILSGLSSPTNQARRAMKSLAEATNDPTLTMDALQDLIKTDLVAALTKMRPILLDAGLAFEIFNDRGGTSLLAIANAIPKLRLVQFELRRAAGESERMANEIRGTLDGSIKRMIASLSNLAVAAGEGGALGSLKLLIDAITVLAGRMGGFSVNASQASEQARDLADSLERLFTVLEFGLISILALTGISAIGKVLGSLGRAFGVATKGGKGLRSTLKEVAEASGKTRLEVVSEAGRRTVGSLTKAGVAATGLSVAYELLSGSGEKAAAALKKVQEAQGTGKSPKLPENLENTLKGLTAGDSLPEIPTPEGALAALDKAIGDAEKRLDVSKSGLKGFKEFLSENLAPDIAPEIEDKWKKILQVLQANVASAKEELEGLAEARVEAEKLFAEGGELPKPKDPRIVDLDAKLETQTRRAQLEARSFARDLQPLTDVERDLADAADAAALGLKELRQEYVDASPEVLKLAENSHNHRAAMEQASIAAGDYQQRLRDMSSELESLKSSTSAATDTQKRMDEVTFETKESLQELNNSIAQPKLRKHLEDIAAELDRLGKKAVAIDTLRAAFEDASNAADGFSRILELQSQSTSLSEDSLRRRAAALRALAEAEKQAARQGLSQDQIAEARPAVLARIELDLDGAEDPARQASEALDSLATRLEGALTPTQKYERSLVELRKELEAISRFTGEDISFDKFLEQNPRLVENMKEAAGLSAGVLTELRDAIQATENDMQGLVVDTLDNFAQAGAQAFIDWSQGAEDAGEAFRQFGLSVLQSIAEIILKLGALKIAQAALGGPKADQGLGAEALGLIEQKLGVPGASRPSSASEDARQASETLGAATNEASATLSSAGQNVKVNLEIAAGTLKEAAGLLVQSAAAINQAAENLKLANQGGGGGPQLQPLLSGGGGGALERAVELDPEIDAAYERIFGGLEGALESGGDAAQAKITEGASSLGKFGATAANLLSTALSGLINSLLSALGSAGGGGGGFNVGGLISSVVGLAFGAIPLASGGIVRSPTLAMVGEAGPEAVVPLSQLTSGGGNVSVNLNLTNNGEPLQAQKVRTQERNDGTTRTIDIFGELGKSDNRRGGTLSRSMTETFGVHRRTRQT